MGKRIFTLMVSLVFLVLYLTGCHTKTNASISLTNESSGSDNVSSEVQTSPSLSEPRTMSVKMPGSDSIKTVFYSEYHSLTFLRQHRTE